MDDDFQRQHVLTHSLLALTDDYSIKSEYPVEWIELSLTYECPNHNIVRHVISSWFRFNLTVIKIAMKTDSTNVFNLVAQSGKGQCQISSTIWEHNILIYCILNAELNITLLHWNKQHFESGIIKWRCCLLDENFHLVLMFTGFGSMQTYSVLNIEPASLHIGTGLTSTCLRSRHLHVVERHTHTMVFWTSSQPEIGRASCRERVFLSV